ncbi:MAG TPA: LytTR family DNA-binding domain-containing protein [Flavobacteriales bacterium]|nr:LytTR family DNA-binding domain-containing protein [Flavobacteriales bacterium]
MKHTCIIVEDEPLALEKTRDYVKKHPGLELLGCFENAKEAQTFLQNNKVDIIFLDIHMDEMSGIELLERSNIQAEVILTTAYHEYALKGFDLNVTDYLLKPFTFARFEQAVQKAVKNKERGNNNDINFIFVKTEYRLEKVFLEDLLYIEGMRDYRRLHTVSKKIMTLQTFGELESMLPSNRICRVHKSYMVAIKKIESIARDEIKIGDKIIPVSETYKKEFLAKIGK